ncbi:MAG TPA: hypothetical protein VHA57_13605 [Actinomycetota bacterium]|nr:hypothetical protein [Actinomycetota bacterium]
MRLRPVSSGLIRAAFFAVLAVVVFVVFRRVMARSSYAAKTFALTALVLAALPMFDEYRRRTRRSEQAPLIWEPMPVDVTFERLGSPRCLAWPAALLLWVIVPVTVLAAGVNYSIGELIHDVPGALGGVAAVGAGALLGLAAWMALRTVIVWRAGVSLGRWPAWTDAPPATLRLRPFLLEWRREPVYYFRRIRPPDMLP